MLLYKKINVATIEESVEKLYKNCLLQPKREQGKLHIFLSTIMWNLCK